MLLIIIYAVAAIAISFLCSVLEAALLSITPSFIAQMQETNPRLYARLSALKNNMDPPLAAILTLNTIAHTVGAAGVGAEVAALYGQAYLGVASAVMTLAILILSEILPKSIGAKYWKQLTPFMCTTVEIMIVVLKPLLYISDYIMGMFSAETDNSTLKEEIRALSRMAEDENVVSGDQYRLISNTLNLSQVHVEDVMTPRTVVRTVKPGMSIRDFDEFLKVVPFSRFPIIDEKKQIYLGYIHKSNSFTADDNDTVDKFARPMRSFGPEAKLEDVMSSMLQDRNHIALVVDAYGNWIGIVTLEDIIETIIGKEIVDETDQVADMRLYAKLKWKRKREQQANSMN
jgi:CBS domain containing-hemolysin-like protein